MACRYLKLPLLTVFPGKYFRNHFISCLLWGACLPFLYSCHTEERVGNTAALAREMKAMKIKRVTPAQLSAAIYRLGEKIAAEASDSLETVLNAYPATDSLCKTPEDFTGIKALEKRYGIAIRLVHAKDTANPQLDPKEQSLLHAYLYNIRNNLPLSSNLQQLNDTLTLYQAPIASGHPWFSRCKDAAGPPLAIWHVLLSHKEVIRRLDPKQLEP